MGHFVWSPGDNIVLSKACHDANIAPWLTMARNLNLEVRWLNCLGNSVDDSMKDCIDTDAISNVIDEKTKLVSLGLASNATGRIHLNVIKKITDRFTEMSEKPYLILDGTHFVPHRRSNLESLNADAIICSAYKFCGPHIGVMAFDGQRLRHGLAIFFLNFLAYFRKKLILARNAK